MISETIKNFFLQLKDVFLNYNFFSDTLDILVVALIIYVVIVQMRKTQAIQVVKGIVLVAIMYAVVSILGMNTSTYLFSKLFSDILIIFVILFSAEIRQALELLGKRRFGSRFSLFDQSEESVNVDMINCVCRACGAMSRNKVGSLILIQRNTLLGDYMKQAVPIDAQITFETLCSIFYPKAPLHDGAVILKDGRIVAARCVVPLKNDREIVENFLIFRTFLFQTFSLYPTVRRCFRYRLFYALQTDPWVIFSFRCRRADISPAPREAGCR